jgi:type IV pilus biogenesis protein PilP
MLKNKSSGVIFLTSSLVFSLFTPVTAYAVDDGIPSTVTVGQKVSQLKAKRDLKKIELEISQIEQQIKEADSYDPNQGKGQSQGVQNNQSLPIYPSERESFSGQYQNPNTTNSDQMPGNLSSKKPEVVLIEGKKGDLKAMLRDQNGNTQMVKRGSRFLDWTVVEITPDGVRAQKEDEEHSVNLMFSSF